MATTSVDYQTLISLIDRLLPDGVKLPDGLHPQDLVHTLQTIINTLDGMAGGGNEHEPAMPVNDGFRPMPTPAEMALANSYRPGTRMSDAQAAAVLRSKGIDPAAASNKGRIVPAGRR